MQKRLLSVLKIKLLKIRFRNPQKTQRYES